MNIGPPIIDLPAPLTIWTRFVTIVTNIYTFPIWGRVLYAHGKIFIQIVWGATV